jgi:hypothetical protein
MEMDKGTRGMAEEKNGCEGEMHETNYYLFNFNGLFYYLCYGVVKIPLNARV